MIVLGMLALMVMVGVAFSIFMRTERMAAGSFVHDVRARQLLFAAKTRAIEAIETNSPGQAYPTNYMVSPGDGMVLSTNDVWARHVPDSLLLDPNFPKEAGWITVNNGRVGYLVINASGLLDANSIGGSPRASGIDPKEIDIAGLSDFGDSALFMSKRPYESIGQMKRAGAGVGLLNELHLVDFARSPPTDTPEPFDVSGSAAALKAKKAALVTAFTAAFPGVDGTVLANSLIDYVDADSVPEGGVFSPSAERVPMINEVRVTPLLISAGDGINVNLRFVANVELLYPFVTYRTGTYTLDYSFTVTATTPAGLIVNTPLEGTANVTFLGSTFTVVILAPLTATLIPCASYPNTEARFNVVFTYLRLREASQGLVDEVDNLRIGLAATQCPYVVIPAVPPVRPVLGTPGGTECADPRFNNRTTAGQLYWLPYALIASSFGGNAVMATNGSISPATTNFYASYFLKNGLTDGFIWMHNADQPLQSETELSYLLRAPSPIPNNPATAVWRSLRLLDENGQKADPILSGFKVPIAAVAKRGFINPNTDVPDVMAAAFRKMPLDRFPGDTADSGVAQVDTARAMTLADAWISDTGSASYLAKSGIISNLMYRSAVSNAVNALLPLPGTPGSSHDAARYNAREFRYEAAYRNLLGLLNPRQNYFIVLLFAQSSARVQLPRSGDTPGAIIDTVRADQTALLELWRDPVSSRSFTNVTTGVVTPIYPMFIRRFEILVQE